MPLSFYFTGVNEALQKAGESFEAQSGNRPPLEALIDTVSKAFGVSSEQLKSRSRKRAILQARSVFACVAVRNHGYHGVEVAGVLSLSSPTVSRIVENGENILLCREICSCIYFTGMTIIENLR